MLYNINGEGNMLSKVEKIESLLRKKTRNSKNYLYSQIIKNERLKRHLTLEEMSKGICSISYLCKLERNAIEPEESYIQAIFERVNLDYKKVGKNILEDGISVLLKAYLYHQYQEIESLYERADNGIFNVHNHFIKALYFLIKKNYQEFQGIITTLDKIKDTLLRDDIGMLIFLVSEYYIKTFQFREAYKHLQYLRNQKFESEELNWLIYEQHFLVGYHLKKYAMAWKYYDQLMKNINIGYPTRRQTIIRLMFLAITAEEYYDEAEKEVNQLHLDTPDQEYKADLLYWKLIIYSKGGNYLRIFEEIINHQLTYDVRFLCLLLYAADFIKDEAYKQQAREIAEKFEFQPSDSFHQKFVRFMLLKYADEKRHLVIEYLKYNIFPSKHMFYHHIYSPTYEEYYLDFLCKTSKYKEALSFYRGK
jgi:transcriptional regulator with XRE-family HTH domain